MSIPADMLHQVFALPAGDRYELAQRLLDSIDDSAADDYDKKFVLELQRRREEMVRGELVIPDWRAALTEIERSLSQ